MTGWVGAIGAVVFIVMFLADGWTRPGYSSTRQPVSALAAISAFTLPGALERTVSALVAAYLLFGFGAFGTAGENDSPKAGLVQRAIVVPGWLWLASFFLEHTYRGT